MADDALAIDFSAERIVKSGKKVVTAHVNATDDRWRFEFARPQGDASIIIVRMDRQSSWLILSKRRQYLEVPIARDHQLAVSETMEGELSRELVGEQTYRLARAYGAGIPVADGHDGPPSWGGLS